MKVDRFTINKAIIGALLVFNLTACRSVVTVYHRQGVGQLMKHDKIRITLTDGKKVKGHFSKYTNGKLILKMDTVDLARISAIELKGSTIWQDNMVYVSGKENPTDRIRLNDRLEVYTIDYRVLKGRLTAMEAGYIELTPGGKIQMNNINSIQLITKLRTGKTIAVFTVAAGIAVLLVVFYVQTFLN